MEDIEAIKQKTHKIVLDILPYVTSEELSDDMNLFRLGLDSVTAITLVLRLEDTFAVQIETSEISMDNFSTITNIVNLIERKIR